MGWIIRNMLSVDTTELRSTILGNIFMRLWSECVAKVLKFLLYMHFLPDKAVLSESSEN